MFEQLALFYIAAIYGIIAFFTGKEEDTQNFGIGVALFSLAFIVFVLAGTQFGYKG